MKINELMCVDEKWSSNVKESYFNGEINVSKTKRTGAINNIFKYKVCWDPSNEVHDDYSKLFGASDPDSIQAYALGGQVSRSSPRPQTPSSSPKETNT